MSETLLPRRALRNRGCESECTVRSRARYNLVSMSLPILKIADQPSREALIRYFHQTERHWTQHMAEETPLDEGQAFSNAELSDVWDANRMLDASLPEGTTPAEVIERVEHLY